MRLGEIFWLEFALIDSAMVEDQDLELSRNLIYFGRGGLK